MSPALIYTQNLSQTDSAECTCACTYRREWDSLDEIVEARRQVAEVFVTMSTQHATMNEGTKYEQAMGETSQKFVIKG